MLLRRSKKWQWKFCRKKFWWKEKFWGNFTVVACKFLMLFHVAWPFIQMFWWFFENLPKCEKYAAISKKTCKISTHFVPISKKNISNEFWRMLAMNKVWALAGLPIIRKKMHHIWLQTKFRISDHRKSHKIICPNKTKFFVMTK